MFEVGVTIEDRYSDNQWGYILNHFCPDRIHLLGEYEPASKVFKGASRGMPNGYIVSLVPRGGIPLQEFVHPDNGIYIFGPNNKDVAYPGVEVTIPTDNDLEMYSWVAGAIVLWSRKWQIR